MTFSAIRGTAALVQDAVIDSASVALAQSSSGSGALGDFWNLVEQAGPLRWPIFIVLAVGLVLVIGKLYELLKDRSMSRRLFDADHRSASLTQITNLVSKQRESMLASLQSTMLNVFQTRPSEGMLHDEIANFVSFQKDQFAVFRRRMEFLSDTAGALGLMGTVWGMFVVFFQGTSDKDVILRGMGIALITTLLGLVVSIILNLSATEVATFFDKRLEQASKKSDELRFRLLELAAATGGGNGVGSREVEVRPVAAPRAMAKVAVAPAAGPNGRDGGDSRASWCYVETEPFGYIARAGETSRSLSFRLRRENGELADGMPVSISVPPDAGSLDGGRREIRVDADDEGTIRFNWNAPERAGTVGLDALVPGQPGSSRRIDVRVEAGPPHHIEAEGNNQAAVAGMRLPNPLGVTVYDRFDNPVPDVAVTFKVKGGSGRLGQQSKEVKCKTGADGRARAPFVVSSEAGSNHVVATLDGSKHAVEFVAFGTEV